MSKAHTSLDHTGILCICRKRNTGNLRDHDSTSSLGNSLNRRSLLRNHGARRVIGARTGTRSGDANDVTRTKGVLRQSAVILDQLLDRIEVGDVDLQRSFNGKESDTLRARRHRERTRVLEDVGRFNNGEHSAEINSAFDFRLASRLFDGVKVWGYASNDGI